METRGRQKRHYSRSIGAGSKANEQQFVFRERQLKMDWKAIMALDIGHIVRSVDLVQLQSVVELLAFSRLEASDMSYLPDNHFLHLFHLSQLCIEYLLHVQNTVYEQALRMKRRTNDLEAELKEAHHTIRTQSDQLTLIFEENQQQKNTIQTYEYLLMTQTKKQEQGQDIFNCLLCSKSFTSKEYLDLHLQRKHTEKLEEPIRKTNEETRVDVELKTSLDRLREDVERQERLMREKNSDLEKTIEYKSYMDAQFSQMQEYIREKVSQEMSQIKQVKLEMERSANYRIEQLENRERELEIMKQDFLAAQRAQEEKLKELYNRVENAALDVRESSNQRIQQRIEFGDLESDDEDYEASMKETQNEAIAALLKEIDYLKSELEAKDEKGQHAQLKHQAARQIFRILVRRSHTIMRRALNHMSSLQQSREEVIEGEEENDHIEALPQSIQMDTIETFSPTYEWQIVPESCEISEELAIKTTEEGKIARIPQVWNLTMNIRGKMESVETSQITLEVDRYMTVGDILEELSIQIGIPHEQICLVQNCKQTGKFSLQKHSHEVLLDSMTVEQCKMFWNSPDVVLLDAIDEEHVELLVQRRSDSGKIDANHQEQKVIQSYLRQIESKASRKFMESENSFERHDQIEFDSGSERDFPYSPIKQAPFLKSKFDHGSPEVNSELVVLEKRIDSQLSAAQSAFQRNENNQQRKQKIVPVPHSMNPNQVDVEVSRLQRRLDDIVVKHFKPEILSASREMSELRKWRTKSPVPQSPRLLEQLDDTKVETHKTRRSVSVDTGKKKAIKNLARLFMQGSIKLSEYSNRSDQNKPVPSGNKRNMKLESLLAKKNARNTAKQENESSRRDKRKQFAVDNVVKGETKLWRIVNEATTDICEGSRTGRDVLREVNRYQDPLHSIHSQKERKEIDFGDTKSDLDQTLSEMGEEHVVVLKADEYEKQAMLETDSVPLTENTGKIESKVMSMQNVSDLEVRHFQNVRDLDPREVSGLLRDIGKIEDDSDFE